LLLPVLRKLYANLCRSPAGGGLLGGAYLLIVLGTGKNEKTCFYYSAFCFMKFFPVIEKTDAFFITLSLYLDTNFHRIRFQKPRGRFQPAPSFFYDFT
jgi:hypothetical protein